MNMLVFEEAIQKAMKIGDLDETLVILTADHAHAFHLVGEPRWIDSLLDLDQVYGPAVSWQILCQIIIHGAPHVWTERGKEKI